MDPTPTLRPCLDCGADRVGPFCHACGQGEVDPNAGVTSLMAGATRDALSWDERAFRTLRVLLSQPGALSAAWAEGKRTRFVPPLRLFLVLGAVLVGLGIVTGWLLPSDPSEPPTEAEDRTEATTVNAAFWFGVGMRAVGLNVVLLLVPLVGFATFVFFNSRRPQLPQHLVHALHVGCVAVVGLIAWRLASLGWALTGAETSLAETLRPSEVTFGPAEGLMLVWLLGITGYATVSIRQFYGTGWGRAVLAAPLVVVIPLVALFGVVFVIYLALLLS